MNYLSGWINVDYNLATAKLDVWSDLEKALPFRNNSVDAFYSHHVIEHIRLECLPYHFSEMFRCLKAGGLIRVGGPNGDSAIRRLLDLDGDWFGEFPKRYRSVGGRFNNFVFCNNEHFWMITADFLQELAEDAGFSDFGVKRAKSETGHPDLFEAAVLAGEHCSEHEYAETLMIEARKPE
jgi:predicted SAM-dependent methyltransferase